ncbi:hypothetical protein AX16_010179 [Volvariella volvacea WC 439]|nr:hypothetical protein AX16_010179 [Volvariella volvacea WC 439]
MPGNFLSHLFKLILFVWHSLLRVLRIRKPRQPPTQDEEARIGTTDGDAAGDSPVANQGHVGTPVITEPTHSTGSSFVVNKGTFQWKSLPMKHFIHVNTPNFRQYNAIAPMHIPDLPVLPVSNPGIPSHMTPSTADSGAGSSKQRRRFPRPIYLINKFFKSNNSTGQPTSQSQTTPNRRRFHLSIPRRNGYNVSTPGATTFIRPEIFIEDWSEHVSGLDFTVSEFYLDNSQAKCDPAPFPCSSSNLISSPLVSRSPTTNDSKQKQEFHGTSEAESVTSGSENASGSQGKVRRKSRVARPPSVITPLKDSKLYNLNNAPKDDEHEEKQTLPSTPTLATPSTISFPPSPEPTTPTDETYSNDATILHSRMNSKKGKETEQRQGIMTTCDDSDKITTTSTSNPTFPTPSPIQIPVPAYTPNFPSPALPSPLNHYEYQYSPKSLYEEDQGPLSEPDVPDLARVHEAYSFAPVQYHSTPLSALTLDGIWDANQIVESGSCRGGVGLAGDGGNRGVQIISLPLPVFTSTPPRSRSHTRLGPQLTRSSTAGSHTSNGVSGARGPFMGNFIQFNFEDMFKYYQSRSHSTENGVAVSKGPNNLTAPSTRKRGLTLQATKFFGSTFSSVSSSSKGPSMKRSNSTASLIPASSSSLTSASGSRSIAAPTHSHTHPHLPTAPSEVAVLIPTAFPSSSSLPSITSTRIVRHNSLIMRHGNPTQFMSSSPSSYLIGLSHSPSASGTWINTKLNRRSRAQTVSSTIIVGGPSNTSTPPRGSSSSSVARDASPTAWWLGSPSVNINGPLRRNSTSSRYLALRKSGKRGAEGRASPPPELDLSIEQGNSEQRGLDRPNKKNVRASIINRLQELSHSIENSDEWELVSLEEIGKRLIAACQDRSRGSWTEEEFLKIVEGS